MILSHAFLLDLFIFLYTTCSFVNWMVIILKLWIGTGISCKEKICIANFQMGLSLSFNNYKIVFKVRISSPLLTWLVNGPNRKETRPRRPRIQIENLETLPCKMSLCLIDLFDTLQISGAGQTIFNTIRRLGSKNAIIKNVIIEYLCNKRHH